MERWLTGSRKGIDTVPTRLGHGWDTVGTGLLHGWKLKWAIDKGQLTKGDTFRKSGLQFIKNSMLYPEKGIWHPENIVPQQ